MIISSIAAVAQNRAIGKDNDLIWSLPKDMRFFVKSTKGHCVIMGRKSWESLPKALPGRTNIVITRNAEYQAEGGTTVSSIEEALEMAQKAGESEAFIIGGGEIYRQSMGMIDRLYYTHVATSPEGAHAFFPELDWNEWKEVFREDHEPDEKHAFAFSTAIYEKIR